MSAIDPASDLPAPALELNPEKIKFFETFFHALRDKRPEEVIPYPGTYPKFEFLSYLVEHKGLLVHGSNNPRIARFEPRPQTDYAGRLLTAVFATADGIWPMFFAILNRRIYRGSLRNAFFRARSATGEMKKFYRFSINADFLTSNPWTEGMIYLLPRESFEPVKDQDGNLLEEWASREPVTPLARLAVSPQDFPFLNQVQGHDDHLSVLVEELLTAYEQMIELEDGYTFRYAFSVERVSQIEEFSAFWRSSQPGAIGELELEPDQTRVELRLRGSKELKQLIQQWLTMLQAKQAG